MMTMTLNKVYDADVLWATLNFQVKLTEDRIGYHIINVNTGVIEMFLDQEGAAVIAIQSLEDAYSEIMADPEREFKLRKERSTASLAPAAAGRAVRH